MRVILALMVVLVGVSERAEACSCSPPDRVLTNDRVVPTDVRIPILGDLLQTQTFDLIDSNGTTVPATTERVPGGVFLVPLTSLEPNADYAVTPVIDRYSGQGFRTGDGPGELVSVPAPTLGTFTRFVIDGSSTCGGPGESFQVNVSETMSEPTMHEVFVGSTTDTIDTRAPAFFFRARPILFLSEVSICEPKFPTSSPDLAIAIRTRDLAGNVSPLSNAIQLKSGGCSATGGPSLLLLAGLLLTRIWAKSRRKQAVP